MPFLLKLVSINFLSLKVVFTAGYIEQSPDTRSGEQGGCLIFNMLLLAGKHFTVIAGAGALLCKKNQLPYLKFGASFSTAVSINFSSASRLD
jgi:hypothetical protein